MFFSENSSFKSGLILNRYSINELFMFFNLVFKLFVYIIKIFIDESKALDLQKHFIDNSKTIINLTNDLKSQRRIRFEPNSFTLSMRQIQ